MSIEPEVLTPFVQRFLSTATLTPSERIEVIRIAQALACKDSAATANLSPETVRARRKRIYRKLGIRGANDLLSVLLAQALRALARGEGLQPVREHESEAPRGEVSAAGL